MVVVVVVVVVVLILSQTCKLKLTRAATMTVCIRKISNLKSLNRRAYILLGMLFLKVFVIIYVVLDLYKYR